MQLEGNVHGRHVTSSKDQVGVPAQSSDDTAGDGRDVEPDLESQLPIGRGRHEALVVRVSEGFTSHII
jgi:hypothetical protein